MDKSASTPIQLHTIKEVCTLLKLCRKTVYKKIKSGELNAINTGTTSKKIYKVSIAALQKWIDQKTFLANPGVEYVKLDRRLVF